MEKKIKDNNEKEGKVFRVHYRKYGINEMVYRFDTRDYREIFRNGFKAWPKGSTLNFQRGNQTLRMSWHLKAVFLERLV